MSRLSDHGLLPPATELKGIGWSLERLAFRFFWVLLLLCPFWWAIDSKKKLSRQTREELRAQWVLAWLVPLIGFWLANPASGFWRGVAAFFALCRLFEILITGLGTALKQSEQARARNLVTIALYAIQVTLIFAILYRSFTPTSFIIAGSPALTPASDFFDYFYISWSNITSLGNNIYVPRGDLARLLEVSTTTAGIFLLGVLLAFGIDAAKDDGSVTKAPAGAPRPPSTEARD